VRRIEPAVSALEEYACFHDRMPLHATQMKTHGPHANESQKRSLDEQLASGIQLPVVEGMTPQQVSNKIANDKKRDAPRHQPAFPAAVEDDSVEELPPLRLDYDSWTSMLQPHHDASEPSQLARRARARRRGWCAGQLALQPFGSSPLLHVQHMHLDMTCAAHAPHAYSTRQVHPRRLLC